MPFTVIVLFPLPKNKQLSDDKKPLAPIRTLPFITILNPANKLFLKILSVEEVAAFNSVKFLIHISFVIFTVTASTPVFTPL